MTEWNIIIGIFPSGGKLIANLARPRIIATYALFFGSRARARSARSLARVSLGI